jgi:hypothetical protein
VWTTRNPARTTPLIACHRIATPDQAHVDGEVGLERQRHHDGNDKSEVDDDPVASARERLEVMR